MSLSCLYVVFQSGDHPSWVRFLVVFFNSCRYTRMRRLCHDRFFWYCCVGLCWSHWQIIEDFVKMTEHRWWVLLITAATQKVQWAVLTEILHPSAWHVAGPPVLRHFLSCGMRIKMLQFVHNNSYMKGFFVVFLYWGVGIITTNCRHKYNLSYRGTIWIRSLIMRISFRDWHTLKG